MRAKLKLGLAVGLIGCLCFWGVRAQNAATPAAQPQTRTSSGRVVDASGNPVAGAHILVRGGPTNVYSGSDGRFEITWRVSAIVRAAPRLLARHRAQDLVGFAEIREDSNVEIKVEPGLTVVATLRDPEGLAVTNGYALFAVDLGFGDGEWVLDTRVLADEEGRLVNTALPRRSKVRVSINAPQLGREEVSAIARETDVPRFEFPTITMRRGNLKLAGKVVDARGNPLAGIRVSTSPFGGQASDSTTTDEKGAFRFEHILPGQVTVTAFSNGTFGSGSGRGGDTDLEVRLTPSGGDSDGDSTATITGTVLDPDGMPAVGVRVMTVPGMPSFPGRVQPEVRTDAEGGFSVQWRPPTSVPMGSPSLIARDPARNLAAVVRISPNTTRQSLQLRPGLAIHGTVVDAAGKPLPKATLRLSSRVFMWNDSIERGNIALNERGEFEVSGLPLGVLYTLTAQSQGHALGTKSVTEDETRLNRIDLEPLVLKPLDRPLAGLVLDADGKPVSGAEIRIANQHQQNSDVFTDSHGRFQTLASEDRTKLAILTAQGSASVEAAGGDTNVLIQFSRAGTPGRAPRDLAPTPGITLEIHCPTNVFKLGDVIPVEFTFRSQGTNIYYYGEHAEDKGRLNDYQLTATMASGEKVPDPREHAPISEEAKKRIGSSGYLRPGESFTRMILLNRWALIKEPGRYSIAGFSASEARPLANAKSAPITITILPRPKEEMENYIGGLTNQVAERLAMQAGQTAKAYDAELHELVMKLMFTGRPEIVPSLLRVLKETGHEGNCVHEALAYYVPPSEEIRRALAEAAAGDVPDINTKNWLLFTLRNYPVSPVVPALTATPGMVEPAGDSSGISLEIRCTNQVLNAGEEVPIEFIISNLGTEDYKFEDRTYDRSGRMGEYRLTAKTADGSFLGDPRETFVMGIGGGLFTYGVLHPGESFSKVIPLNRWALVKDPGTYEVTGTYHCSGRDQPREAVDSAPIRISISPRTSQEMEAYIKELTEQINLVVAQRGTNTGIAPSPGLDELVRKLMYTCSPAAVPALLETMYEPSQGYWQAEALLYYIPRSEDTGRAIRAAAARRGLASNMQYLLRQYEIDLNEEEMKEFIRRSLAPDSPQTWAAGALAAQQYSDDSFTPRLIALATQPKGAARMQAIYALAKNRTSDGVETLKELLNDPEDQIHNTTEQAIRSAYTSRGNSRGRPLEPDDFDVQYQQDPRFPEPRPANLVGRPLPDLSRYGLAAADHPAGRPLLLLLLDAGQRPSRHALGLLKEQRGTLEQKNVAVVVLQVTVMQDDAFTAWKQEAASPFPVGRFGADADSARLAWGASALPWLILTDETHKVVAQGFAPDAIEVQLDTLRKAGQ